MNLCFLIGKILEEIKYNFIIEGENTAIVEFEIELQNKSRIQIKDIMKMQIIAIKN